MSRFLKPVLIACGTLCLGLGLLGILLPGVPTTPFLLLAAYCYARGSQRCYHWLLNNRLCGPYLRDYREGRGLARRHKIVALILLWLGVGTTVIWLVPAWWAQLLLLAIAAAVTVYLQRLPTRRE